MAATLSAAPVLSTPAEHMFEDPTPVTTSPDTEPIHARTDEELLALPSSLPTTCFATLAGSWKPCTRP
ncbi:hypothetical protein HYQ46_010686 [Verticillium longisporum]|nr:hypothetical protein HYQ46_010686 [Verticillium longisporum]